jgi:hypothetical protein
LVYDDLIDLCGRPQRGDRDIVQPLHLIGEALGLESQVAQRV